MMTLSVPLTSVLKDVFGFDAFRPHQEEACRAAAAGQDVLLVMPTGAGKSLCYQLPGIARGGTTLVISPLIALMEDQVSKLKALGVAAERIHSGRPRPESHEALTRYLAGGLSFLFVAPERLAVPGFADSLSRHKPTLVAVDEAHCISEWGHDFRPEYRLLGRRLPALRPAPIIALTATATPRVQQDIAEQLGLAGPPKILIHGFRRENLAIEMLEMNPSLRPPAALRVLRGKDRLPAILYAPTRKSAESLAELLAKTFRARAYHAGMRSADRDRVQTDFLEGRLDAVVATIAFGMGVDKSNVRTVIHMALPASVEAYYQEIGRAGRDGKESRAILLHGYVDRKTHEFFLERDFPDPKEMARVFGAIGTAPLPAMDLGRELGLDPDTLDRRLERLAALGAIEVSQDGDVTRLTSAWRDAYAAQRSRRMERLEEMTRLARVSSCRMTAAVRHFGDRDDSGERCGLCDACAPESCVAMRFRPPSDEEMTAAAEILKALQSDGALASGSLFRRVLPDSPANRRTYDRLLSALARDHLVLVTDESFEKEGRAISYRRVTLAPDGRRAGASRLQALRFEVSEPEAKTKPRRRGPSSRAARADQHAPTESKNPDLIKRLKRWRSDEAAKRGVPAFVVLHDRTIAALAAAMPRDLRGLLSVKGIGEAQAGRYGVALLRLLA